MQKLFKEQYLFEWYYLIVIIGYVATVFTNSARPGVLALFLMIVAALELFLKKKMNIHSTMDVLIVFYFVYRAGTIICIRNGGMPLSVYAQEAVATLVPMIFYFVGKACTDREEGMYRRFMYAMFVLGVVGLIFYITAPQFYCDYLYDWSYISKADASTMRVRMHSVTGCTLLGAMMVYAMAVGTYFLCDVDSAADKLKKNRIFGAISIVFAMAFAFLSNQRSAMVAALLILVYLNYIAFTKFDSIPKKIAIYEIIIITVVILGLCAVRFDFILKIWARLASLPGAISQRSEQWVAAVNNMYSSWFGNGLGANGHKALGIEGAHVIADGGLVKMYCEEGVIGFSLFVYIMYLTFSSGVKAIKKTYAEIAIVAVSILLSIGSNILAFQLATPIFWFAVGRIADKTTYKKVEGKS